MFVMESTCGFVKHWYVSSRKYIMQWINALASREHKLDFQFLVYVSSNICCIRTVGLISIQFIGIDQLRILCTSTKIYGNWVSTSGWLVCLKTAITFACVDLPTSVHNDRHFSANGFVTVRPIAMKFLRDYDNVLRFNFQEFLLNLSNFTPWN